MMKKDTFIIIYNPSSGAKMPLSDFKKMLKKEYPPHKYLLKFIEIKPDLDFPKLLQNAYRHSKNFMVCGGDGTVRETIQHLADFPDITLAIIPTGTFNLLAKDLGQSLNLEEAIKSMKAKKTQQIDLGKVNDLYFANISSIGIYTQIAKDKEILRKKGVGRLFAALIATYRAMKQFRTIEISAKVDHKKLSRKTSIVTVANNRYHLKPEKIGQRSSLNQHKLHFLLLKKVAPLRLFQLIFLSLLGKLKEQREFEEYLSESITITSTRPSTFVTLDGEVYKMDFPLKYEILPNKLKVKIYSPSKNV